MVVRLAAGRRTERTNDASSDGGEVRSFARPSRTSKPLCGTLPVEAGLGVLVRLVAEVAVDPRDYRHRGPRHAGDEQDVYARHEHLADPEMAEQVEGRQRWRGARVVEGVGLENRSRCCASVDPTEASGGRLARFGRIDRRIREGTSRPDVICMFIP